MQLNPIIEDYYFAIFLVCCLGHAIIWVRAINWMHGIRSQAAWTDVVRLGMHFILSGLPIIWFLYAGFHFPEPFWDEWPTIFVWLLFGYLWLIFVLGLVLFPVIWITYLLRREPACSKVVEREEYNVGRALGKLPAGTGRRGWKAHLPGNQAFELEMVDRELSIARLPEALDGLRILHLSDLHFCGRPGRAYFERVFHMCAKRGCDLLVLTGDLVDSPKHHHWLQLLHQFKPTLGKWAILGNHDVLYDPPRSRAELAKLGFQLFDNDVQTLMVRDVPVLVAGNVAPWLLPLPELASHPVNDAFRIALIHSPDQFRWAVQHQFDLALAGHNHGGQIRLPGFGSIFVPSKTGRQYDCGVFQEGNTILHVSRGLSGGHPVRYFCRPEATWLTLRKI